MFNFMKKGVSSVSGGSSGGGDDEKERRKREKKLRKEAKNAGLLSGSMSTEELLRLDEVRRSLKIRGRRKEKEKLPSGITADYSAEFFAQLDIDRAALSAELSGEGDSIYELDRGNEEIVASVTTTIESRYNGAGAAAAGAGGAAGAMGIHSMLVGAAASGNGKHRSLPPVPPKPPKRGILKGSRSNVSNVHEEITIASPEAQLLVMRNTMQNELPFDGSRSNSISGAATGRSSMGAVGGAGSAGVNPHTSGTAFTSVESLRSDEGGNAGIQRAMTLPTTARYAPQLPQHHSGNLRVMTSPSPSADSLTDTTNSSFATPPFSLSPIGESQGIDRWSRVHVFEDVELPLPPIKLVQLPPARELVIRRQKSPRNDFGFSLRKAICLDRAESLTAPTFKPVIFAEPGAGGGATGLLPGDRLLKVNGTPVSELSREVIIEMIRNSGDSVTVEVQPVSELVELSKRCMPPQGIIVTAADEEGDRAVRNANCNTLKRSASKRFKQQPRHSSSNNTNDSSSRSSVGVDDGSGDGDVADLSHGDGERVWLVHRGGFCAALCLPQSPVQRENHKVTIRLLHNGVSMMVDEDDIEKQNAAALDLVEDICDLKQLNEASVLHCLRQRFASNLIHTKAGPTLLVVNPMAPLSLYSEKVVSMFRGCKTEDMPPHIYSLAQTAYRAMLETRRDQSLIFMGRSGSGKTTSFKHALYYLALAAGSYNNFLNAEKVNSINIILEAFGNTKTCLNANATRFTQLLSLDFDQTGQIASASVQVLLPERQRAGRRQPNDHSFHIMSRLLAGAEGLLQKELHLDNISAADNHPFVSLSQKLEERHRAGAEFMRTTQALETLNIEPKAVRGIWSILAAIYHLGLAGVTKLNAGPASRVQFANPSAARRAATLLGVSMEDLTAAAFNATGPGSNTSPSKSPTDSTEQAWESLEALAVGLYSEALAAVVALINKAICTSAHTIASIMLVDTPGFQNPASCGMQTGATLSDLRHNYLQERLQLLFHHTTLVAPRDRYAQELVEIDTEGMPETNPGPLVSLIDKAPQNHVVRSSQRDLREHDRRGLLWLLDEESMYPNCNDDTFLERVFAHYGDREHQTLLRKCAGPKQFVLQHLQGTNPVLYTVDGWVRHSREHPAIRNAVTLLQDSSRDEISRLYIGSLTRGMGGIVFCGSIAGLEGTQSLRRVSSIRRSFTSAGVKRNSIMLQVKFTVDGIIDTLRRTGTHFVHCYMLQHNAGQHSSYSSSGSPNAAALQSSSEDMVNVPLLRSQLRGSQVLEAARLHRLGFPESVPLAEFVRRFGLLAGVDTAGAAKDITVEQILAANEVDTATYRIGPSQILFRSGVLSELEAKRDELLSDRIIQLQAYCRGYLARKQVARRRVQELAVRCIQRNVKAFLAVRDWPWWRLLVRVTPLLNVHRTEEQLKLANEELAMLRTKLEKIENDRNELKTDNQKLEAKPPLVLTADREDGAEKANEAIGGANASAPTVSSVARTAVGGAQTTLLMSHTTNTASVKSKIPTVDTGINGTAKVGQIKRSAERGSETVKLQSRRLVTAKQTENDIKSGEASKHAKSTKTVTTKIISSNNIGTAITNGSSTSSKAAPIETKTQSEKTVFKKPQNTFDTLDSQNSTSNTKQTSTSKSANTIQLNSKTDTHTTTQSLYNSKPQTTTCSSINIETKQTTLSSTPNVNQKSSDNSKFLERVLEAMRSSKPQNSTGLTKPSTFVLSSKTTKITSTSSAANSGPLSPPPTTNGGGHPNPLSNGGGSTSSLSSNASVSTNASSRPPVPPQSQQRARKQVDLLSKQRERSTSSYASGSTTTSRRSQQSYDSEDGLLMPDMKYQSSYQNRFTKSSTNTTITNGTASSTKSYLSNGYGSSGISSTVSSASSLSSRISGNVKNPSTSASETAVEVSLKLPLPKSDFLSTTGSSGNAIRNSASERLRSLSQRSPSPALSTSSHCSSFSSTFNTNNTTTPRATPARLTTPPRRVFPQTYTRGDPLDVYQMHNLEQSPVVFDANLSFVLGCKKQPVHQTLRASPSYEDPQTTSAYLSEKIQNFLRRTDHVQEEWTAMGKRSRRMGSVGTTGSVAGSLDSGRTTPTNSVYDDDTINLIERQRERNSMERCSSVGRSRSSQNILTKAFQLTKTLPHTPTSRSNSMARELSETDDDHTIQEEDDNDMDELSEMTVDLAEERSTANIATERLEAETAERLKLEKELNEQQNKVKNLQETSEKLEMELICAKSDLNGISEDEDPENEEGGSGVYKLKYERVARELEFTKRRLQTQHEHDLEQLVGLKKQLEKKLSDAYEEVEEQRQVVGQWKRKAQKMTNEMNDLRMLLEEQNGRNNLLEKKQRKFDAECQSLQDAARLERQTKDRLSREKDVLIAEKFTLEQTLADTRLELELKEEKLASLQRELEEMTFGGSTEEEIAQLRRSKNELDRRVKEQEEELDEMAGQVQLLEQAKLRLEMTLETMRKDARREAQQRDDELEEARNSSYKKLKALECQLETEHEERTLLLREKHELERRLSSMEDQDRMDRQAEEAATQKLKRDLRKYKALLKDAQAQLERSKAETPGKALIRQLRNQLEDAESARALVMKARQAAEAELAEVQAMFEESQKGRNDAEERANAAHRDRAELQAQIEENEEELAELMKKYSAAVKQLNTEQIAASEYEFKLSELEAERNNLKEQVCELQQRLENVENMADPSTAMLSKRLELRTKELESRLDLEQATRTRLEVQVSRLKETLEKVQNDVAQAKGREMQAQDALKKSQKSLRDMREEYHVVAGREQESVTKRKDLEKKLEQVESESSALKNDLRLALQRIADLQQAMEEGDDDVSDSEDSRSTEGSLSDLEERLRPIKVKRTTNGELMSPSTTKTLVHEKDDNSPRITLTSPSSPHIHKLAKQANAVADGKTSDATTGVGGDKKATTNSISTEKSSESLKNGDAASYA